MGEFVKVARITKARKRQGRLVVQPCGNLPFLLHEGMTAHVVPPSLDVPRTVTLREAHAGEDCVIAFEGVEDYSQLLEYVGRYLLVARDELDGGLLPVQAADLSGFEVEDARLGALGRVVDVSANAFQATLVVEGAHGEVLIPLVDEFVDGLDEDSRTLFTRVPDGLVEG